MEEFRKLVEIMARLRADGGCEWDRAQSHETLRQYLVEETHEVIDAIRGGNPDSLCEELGDLLLQILFHAQNMCVQLHYLDYLQTFYNYCLHYLSQSLRLHF